MSDVSESRIDGRTREARAARLAQAQPETTSQPADEGEDLTYIPGPEDPPIAKWRGHEFKANVPKRIKDRDMIESARGNRFYRVGADTGAATPNQPPKTAMQYRAHVLAWMKGVETVEDLAIHWADDRVLRHTCEIGHDDIAYLGTLIEPKLKQMRMAEGKTELQVAEIWINHGTLELPWRAG